MSAATREIPISATAGVVLALWIVVVLSVMLPGGGLR